MNKKIIVLLASLVMVLTLAVGGTLAYFTDTDNEKNTFTVGNVNIHIDEWMVEDDEWVEYEDGTELSPIAQSKAPFNKLVETYNDGSKPAYIRTFITCPTDMYWALGLGFNSGAGAAVGTNDKGENRYPVTWEEVGTFTINGEETSVFLCEYEGIVDVNESVLSLTKVWLYDTVTNEQVEEFDLENGLFNIYVASEAIQSDNLTYAEAMEALGAIDQAKMDELFGE